MKEKNGWDKDHEYLMDWSTMQLPSDALTEQKKLSFVMLPNHDILQRNCNR
jgi:hypothetical protein